jgi:sporulation protein YtfJ
MENTVGNIMDITMSKLRDMVDVNTVVGDTITTPDGITLIPISKVSVGFATAGGEYPVKENSGFSGGNGAGIKIEPIGFLVIKEGNVRMVNVTPPANTTLDRLIEMIPSVLDRVEGYLDCKKQEQQKF